MHTLYNLFVGKRKQLRGVVEVGRNYTAFAVEEFILREYRRSQALRRSWFVMMCFYTYMINIGSGVGVKMRQKKVSNLRKWKDKSTSKHANRKKGQLDGEQHTSHTHTHTRGTEQKASRKELHQAWNKGPSYGQYVLRDEIFILDM